MTDTSFALYWRLSVSDYSVILLLFHDSEGVTRLFFLKECTLPTTLEMGKVNNN